MTWTIDKLKPGYMIVWTDYSWQITYHIDDCQDKKVGIVLSGNKILSDGEIYFKGADFSRGLACYAKTCEYNGGIAIPKRIEEDLWLFRVIEQGKSYVVLGSNSDLDD